MIRNKELLRLLSILSHALDSNKRLCPKTVITMSISPWMSISSWFENITATNETEQAANLSEFTKNKYFHGFECIFGY